MGDAKDYSGSEGPLPKRVKVDGDASEGKYISGNSRQEITRDSPVIVRSPVHASLFQYQTRPPRDASIRSTPNKTVKLEENDSKHCLNKSESPAERTSDDRDSENGDQIKLEPTVIAASGDNIIAVANPALAMSPAIIPQPKCSH